MIKCNSASRSLLRGHLQHVLLVIMITSLFPFVQPVLAQQEVTVGNDFGVGARAMGMGGAFTAIADDSTALHWNPAGLSQIKRAEFFGALSHEKRETETEYFGTSDSTFVSKTRPNSFGVVLPVPVYRGGLAFAPVLDDPGGFRRPQGRYALPEQRVGVPKRAGRVVQNAHGALLRERPAAWRPVRSRAVLPLTSERLRRRPGGVEHTSAARTAATSASRRER